MMSTRACGLGRYEPMTAEYVLSHLKEQELCTPTTGATATALRSNWFSTRLHHPARTCPVGCKCGKRPLAERPRLQYFAVLPNYGQQYKAPYGGSREPYGYLQFILDFWHNLPNVIIFSQDDCLARGCAWGNALPQLGMRLSNWRSEWGFRAAPTSRNCLCKFIRETNYRSRGYFWYRWMAFLEEVADTRPFYSALPRTRPRTLPRTLPRSHPRTLLRTRPPCAPSRPPLCTPYPHQRVHAPRVAGRLELDAQRQRLDGDVAAGRHFCRRRAVGACAAVLDVRGAGAAAHRREHVHACRHDHVGTLDGAALV
jgi:hypothetical protein